MKKILCTIILTLLMLSTLSVTVSATENEKYEKLLLLGDSITYGYGLEGDRDSCRSYGNQLREHLGVEWENFKNAAVNGDTSADLLALLPSLQKEVKEADLIVITIGGNDLLGIIWGAVAAVGGNAGDIIAMLNDPAYVSKFLEKITMDVISNTIIKYSVNMSGIVSYIRSNNPNARVLFLAQYDPMSGLELGTPGQVTSSALKLLNTQMRESVEAGGCEYLDVYTPFVGKAAELTNMLSADIHPNQAGHDKIFEIISKYLTASPEETDNVQPEETIPSEENPDTVYETDAPSGTVSVLPKETENTDKNDENKGRTGCRATFGYEGCVVIAFAITVTLAIRRKNEKQ